MATQDGLRKDCPRCGTPHDLTAPECLECGRRFRTQFMPDGGASQAPVIPQAPAAPGGRLRFARPKPALAPAGAPPEVRHRVALAECSRRFQGLAPYYALAALAAPTVLVPALALAGLRAAESGLRAEVAALGVDAEAWAAPLRRARRGRILRGVGTALALVALFAAFAFLLHKGINALDSKMDPPPPGAGRPGAD